MFLTRKGMSALFYVPSPPSVAKGEKICQSQGITAEIEGAVIPRQSSVYSVQKSIATLQKAHARRKKA